MKIFPLSPLVAVLSLIVIPASLRAQSPGAAQANEIAYALFSAGDYTNASSAYQKILKDYPTDAVFPVASIQLAFSQYFLGQLDSAQATLTQLLTFPGLPSDMAQIGDHLMPQILSSKAAALPEGDVKRKTAFEDAAKKFSEFITKYPQAPEIESVVFGRAVANFQIGNFDKVVEDMKTNIQKFPSSGTIDSSKNLLALVLATQGSAQLGKGDSDQANGLALLKQAELLFQQIIAGKKDITLINDVNFQMGEILFMQAAFSPEAERSILYQKALDSYKSVLSKDDMIKLQEGKIQSFPARRAAAIRANQMELKKQLDKDNIRELQKLEEIKAKPDQVATAILKMGEIFFNAKRYNESRVVIRHATPFLISDDEKMRALYYKTMSYAVQGAVENAVQGYKEFMAAYPGKEIAESLPFAMGSMYLNIGKPIEAIGYFEASLTQYPKGRLAGLSVVSKAQAQVALKQFDEALKTFQEYLANNPSPEVALVAQYGLAGIYKDTAKWEDAIAAYQLVKNKFPGSAQAVEGDYWIAIITQQKGNNAGAVPLLEVFIKTHETHPLTPLAMYALGSAQIALGKSTEGVATLAMLAEKFPNSQAAPYTYFMRAQLASAAQKSDEVVTLMRQFIEKYPTDDRVFSAYEALARSAVSAGKPEEAISAYMEFVQRYPKSPKAAAGLHQVVELQRGNAERLAINYASLNAADQAKWKNAIQESVSTAEVMLAQYPSSPDLAQGLQSLLAAQRLLLRAELKNDAQVEDYFQKLSEKTVDNGAKSQILFALASFISEKDQTRALLKMNDVYDPAVVYSPKDLEIYGLALIANKKYDEATTIFQKLTTDYPSPSGTTTNIPLLVQEAQATALFGLARVAQEKKQTAEAGKLFQQLKMLYPWSPKALEADYGIAESLQAENKFDEALKLLSLIIRAPTASAELRANSFLLGGNIIRKKMEETTDPKQKTEFREQAIDYYLKIAQFYSGVPIAASEGLWQGAQLLEAQANGSVDAVFKTKQLDRARGAYRQLMNDYQDSPYAPQANARLSALGGS